MSDERFEEFLQREARAYNEPPAATPRDEMWAAVSKAREARREARRAADDAIVVLPSHRPARGMRRLAPWIGMAATLLLGVGIGRFALQRAETGAPEVATMSPADPAPRDGAAARVPGDAGIPSPTEVVAPSPSGRDATVDASPTPRQVAAQGTRERSAVRDVAPRAPRGPANLASNGTSANGASAPTPYGIVSQRHLASAEALITVVTATPRDALMDSLTTQWAREMLSGTRLLLDSPAGDDPLRRRLLEDLETLLVQLVQRSGGAVDERDLIDRTLQRTQLLTRLRTNAAGT